MKHRDAYETLGVPKNADAKAIKGAFRKKAKKLHPDKPGGSKEAFQELQRAYALLEDAEKRADYDVRGDAADNPNSLRQRAEAALAIEVVQCASQVDDGCNIIELVTMNVAQKLEATEQMILNCERQAAKLKKAASKVCKRGDGENILARALEQSAENAAKQAQAGRMDAEWKREMLAVLGEYYYLQERQPEMSRLFLPKLNRNFRGLASKGPRPAY